MSATGGRGGEGAMGGGDDKRERATRIANSSDAPTRIDVHWLTSEAIGAWNKLDTLEAEVERLRDALREVAATLGGGGCERIACPGCAYEMRSAASTARDALDE